MSKILFRGKYKDTGEWVHWDVFGRTTTHTGKQHVLTATSGAHTSYYYHAYQIMEKIDRTTVGQYTGLKDKNGKRIFEGDLLNGFQYPFFREEENVHNYFAEVVWFEDSPAFGLVTHKYPQATVRGISDGNAEYIGEDFAPNDWEIIGNIHDNPELVGGADAKNT